MGEVQAERDCQGTATTQSQQFSKAGNLEGVRDAGGDRLGKLLSEQKEVDIDAQSGSKSRVHTTVGNPQSIWRICGWARWSHLE